MSGDVGARRSKIAKSVGVERLRDFQFARIDATAPSPLRLAETSNESGASRFRISRASCVMKLRRGQIAT